MQTKLFLFVKNDIFILKQKYANGLRFTMMLLGGLFSDLASKFIGYPSAGALGCITIAFVAGTGWRRKLESKGVGIYVHTKLINKI